MIGDIVMKKLLASMLVCMIVFAVVSCSSPMKQTTKRQNNLNTQFSAVMNVSLDKLNADGTITRFSDGNWEAEFDSPNTLSGVKLSFEGNNVSASYKGLNFSVPRSAIPVKAMLTNLISAVDTAAREEELQGSESEGLLNITGSLDGGDYTLSVDSNGNIHTFEMPNNLLKIAFSDVNSVSAPQGSQTTEAATDSVTDTAETASTAEASTTE